METAIIFINIDIILINVALVSIILNVRKLNKELAQLRPQSIVLHTYASPQKYTHPYRQEDLVTKIADMVDKDREAN